MTLDPKLTEKIEALKKKFEASGQDMVSYLDGLLYSDYLTYWDYVSLDTLLSLQKPKTSFPDEPIFIIYHQITELYFNLVLREMEQLCKKGKEIDGTFFLTRIQRINRYFEALTTSFEVMIHGMEKEQFLKFRMALLPASGFQSAQYRKIEIASTDFFNLIDKDLRAKFSGKEPIPAMYESIYWKKGATELATGKKTLTLKQFEERYSEELIRFGEDYAAGNLWSLAKVLETKGELTSEIKEELRFLDVYVNITWPLAHYKSAVRYLERDPEDIAATGGTNWQKYLPPRFQKRIFYPELWSETEIEEWGKNWVQKALRQSGK
ncbi:MAG: tryptophan 2,3-dioxygenase [Sphingobacteriales bacterium]|jgi:tryptophan 2,3-dioxygenase